MCVHSGDATHLNVSLQPASRRFAVRVNFQPAGNVVPTGYLADSGVSFGEQDKGYCYGWETNLSDPDVVVRGAGRSQDLRYDTFCNMQADGNHVWTISVPNGLYSVHVVMGDPSSTNGVYRLTVEGVPMLDGVPVSSNRWVEGIGTVGVHDGKLTLSNATGASNNCLDCVEISAVEPPCWDWWWIWAGPGEMFSNGRPLDLRWFQNWGGWSAGIGCINSRDRWHLAPIVVHTNNAEYFGCFFSRDLSDTNLVLRIQASDTLAIDQSWTDLGCFTNGCGWSGCGLICETNISPVRAGVTVLDARPVQKGSSRFIRLWVIRP